MKLWGVFIGVDHYKAPLIPPLRYARADAMCLYNLFEAGVVHSEREVHVLLDAEATRARIMSLLGEHIASRSTKYDMLFVHWACHGSLDCHPSVDRLARYLVAYDTEYDSVFATGISMERDLKSLCERVPCSNVVWLVDSCFSGHAGGRTFECPGRRRLRYDGRRSLAKLHFGDGRVFVSACEDHQLALEDSALGHGVFSYYAWEALRGAYSSEPTISVTAFYDLLCRRVRDHTGGAQTPVMNGRTSAAALPVLR